MKAEQTKAEPHAKGVKTPPWRRAASALLAVVLLAGIGRLLYVNQDQFRSIHQISIPLTIVIALSFLVDYGLIGTILNTCARALGYPLRAREYLGLSYMGGLYSLALPMQGGLFFKSYYLKVHQGMPLKLFTLISLLQMLFFILVSAVMGATLIVFSGYPIKDELLVILLCFVGIAVVSACMISGHLLIKLLGSKYEFMRQFSASWKQLVHSHRFWSLIGQSLLRACLGPIRIYLTFHALGLPVSFYDVMIAGFSLMVIGCFSITPGNLGVRELVLGFIMTLLGYSAAQVVLVGVVERAIQILVLIPSGLGSTLLLFGRLWITRSSQIPSAEPDYTPNKNE